MRALSEGLRQEVKPYNIRSTILSPGAVDTELLESISESDIREGVRDYIKDFALPPETLARAVAYAMSQPPEVDINEILFRPTAQEV